MSPIVTWNRPQIVVIFVLNILWLLIHAISISPIAGEAVREYLHGSLLIDFVGQQSPVSRLRLVGCDVLVLALQLVMGSWTRPKEVNKIEITRVRTMMLKNEERGGVRKARKGSNCDLSTARIRGADRRRTGSGEERVLRGNREATASERSGDAYYSGQHVIANVYILDTIREQWRQTSPATIGSSGNESMGAAAAAELARRRFQDKDRWERFWAIRERKFNRSGRST
ncbi:MAG: hypothetical protein Q9205_002703 [Flavoplaca limonia]